MRDNPFRQEVIRALAQETGLSADDVSKSLARPPNAELGDFAFPCFVLSKELKKAPPAIASELQDRVAARLELIREAKAAGPYLNFFVHRERYIRHVLEVAVRQGPNYGHSNVGGGKVIAIDFSSPNIAKPFHVGHLRSTIIGGALYRLFETLGYHPVGINHLGDWGTQFGKLTVAIERWGADEDLDDLMALNSLYVKYHQEEAEHPELADEAREWFRRQEANDPRAVKVWQKIRDVSLKYFQEIYDRLGVKFDAYTGESFFNDKMEAVVDEAKAKGLVSVSEGATVIDLSSEKIQVPALLKKADGATLYLTRDLAAVKYRHKEYGFDQLLYVVGQEQALHFQQLFSVLKLMRDPAAGHCIHVKFGRVQGMSTRKGNTIYLEELLDEAKSRALANMRNNVEKRPDLDDEEAVAEAVGIAAIFFSDLSKQRIKDYSFDWDRAISFEGDTGPYLMNAHARISGIIRRCGIDLNFEADVAPLVEPEAFQLITLINRFEEVLEEAARTYEPSVLSQYLLDLAHALHASYNVLRVKGEEPARAEARLLLFAVVKQVLAKGLGILGIPALETM